MTFTPFALEEFMSHFEQEVDVNLSESGVHPVTLGELLKLADSSPEALASIDLNYPHANGIPELREAIARLYGADPDQVLVTVGAIEANYAVTRAVVGSDDGIAVMTPNYLQIWGVARNHGARLATFGLSAEDGWRLDRRQLEAATTPGTRMVAVCNPNNPTGKVLGSEEMDAIVAAAERVGAWVLADEVYRGAERTGEAETPTFWGRGDRVVVVGSMSKAYGLPGLRIGWAVGPPELISAVWRRHEYTTISASMLANHLAALALSEPVRTRLLARTRGYIRSGYPVLESWVADHSDLLSIEPPDAAAIGFARYHLDLSSEELSDRIRREQSVLVVPGAFFGVEGHLRISFGLPHDYLNEGLDRIGKVLASSA